MSKVYGGLIGYDEFYEEIPVIAGIGFSYDRTAELGEAIRRRAEFHSIRFCGLTDDGQFGFIGRDRIAEYQVTADFDPESGYADVRYVMLKPGSHVVHNIIITL